MYSRARIITLALAAAACAPAAPADLARAQTAGPARADSAAPHHPNPVGTNHVAAAAPPALPAPRAGAPPCRGDQLDLRLDDGGGAYNGMSHSGTRLVLRNAGPAACAVPAFPALTLFDSAGAVPATARTPGGRFMHPGPFVPPVVVPAGAAVTDTMTWVQGPVYAHNVCRRPTTLALAVGGATKRVPFAGQLCGDRAAGGMAYNVTRFAVELSDPAPTPGARPAAVGGPAARQGRDADPCPGKTTQADLNACADRRAARADSAVQGAYAALVTRVANTRRPALADAEAAWERYREAYCRYRASAVEGGSMQPMVRGFCREEVNRARARQLRHDAQEESR